MSETVKNSTDKLCSIVLHGRLSYMEGKVHIFAMSNYTYKFQGEQVLTPIKITVWKHFIMQKMINGRCRSQVSASKNKILP